MSFIGRRKFAQYLAIAGTLGIGVGAISLLLKKEEKKLSQMPKCVQTAVSVMENHPEIMERLGQQYQLHETKFKRLKSEPESVVAATVPIVGSKDSAEMIIFAKKAPDDERHKLYRIEMAFDSVKGKRAILFDLDTGRNVEN